MNDERRNTDDGVDGGQHDMLAQLIRSAGRREGPPPEHYERVWSAAQSALAEKRRQRAGYRGRLLAIAASACIAAVSGVLWLATDTGQAPQLRVMRIVGIAEWRTEADKSWSKLDSVETVLEAGGEIRTSDGSGLSVLLGEVSIRLAGATTVFVTAANELHLEQGKIYIDSGGSAAASMRVVTSAATATDIGTQFEVRFRDGDYRLRVREGKVQLASEIIGNNDTAQSIDSGLARTNDEVRISSDGRIKRGRVDSDDNGWAWAENLATAPVIDGESLTVLLDWVARETGREVVFADPLAELRSKQTIMHGTVQNLAPLQALDVALTTTDLTAMTNDSGRILIKAAAMID